MKKKLSLDKELITSPEQVLSDLDGASVVSVGGSCRVTQCLACFPTDFIETTCSVLTE